MPRRRAAGFTLIELVATLALFAIMVSFAVPAFRDTIRNARRASATNDIVLAFQLARAESIKRNQQVTVCPMSDPNVSPPTCAVGAAGTPAWRYGWIAFVEISTAGAGTTRPDLVSTPSDVVLKYNALRTTRTENNGVNISSSGITSIASTTSDLAAASFSMQPFNRTSTQGTITICDARGASYGRRITVDGLGRPTTCAYDATTCPLTCP